jgi:hypothetical protein
VHLAFVLNIALGSPACFQGHRRLARRHTEALAKRPRIFRLNKARTPRTGDQQGAGSRSTAPPVDSPNLAHEFAVPKAQHLPGQQGKHGGST